MLFFLTGRGSYVVAGVYWQHSKFSEIIFWQPASPLTQIWSKKSKPLVTKCYFWLAMETKMVAPWSTDWFILRCLRVWCRVILVWNRAKLVHCGLKLCNYVFRNLGLGFLESLETRSNGLTLVILHLAQLLMGPCALGAFRPEVGYWDLRWFWKGIWEISMFGWF